MQLHVKFCSVDLNLIINSKPQVSPKPSFPYPKGLGFRPKATVAQRRCIAQRPPVGEVRKKTNARGP